MIDATRKQETIEKLNSIFVEFVSCMFGAHLRGAGESYEEFFHAAQAAKKDVGLTFDEFWDAIVPEEHRGKKAEQLANMDDLITQKLYQAFCEVRKCACGHDFADDRFEECGVCRRPKPEANE